MSQGHGRYKHSIDFILGEDRGDADQESSDEPPQQSAAASDDGAEISDPFQSLPAHGMRSDQPAYGTLPQPSAELVESAPAEGPSMLTALTLPSEGSGQDDKATDNPLTSTQDEKQDEKRHSAQRPFVCPECGTGFKYKHHMQRHSATIHQKLRPFVCDVEGCGRSFGLRENMNKHKRMVHENIRPFPCRICGAKFKQREHLLQHLAKHKRDGDKWIEEDETGDEKKKD
eukprot:Plantae.Rhodophyta-Rhodochaete_pulchella.ctg7675.p1 GENE.Plantae.Rhodophyta-Rhodochaete_pulchella.ctg7675~~Plantae.Rhodophyta-Rhodochaete_pulchella.ctg7675.p1  ORF type:complete len:229 (+),score=23.17 Plantae.Rhodophyta-Rhodochaete_pulchella.ctg7675:439-1125(+)